MEEEKARLESFKSGSWQCAFVNPETLAKCGFYYTGEDDRVQCFHCKGRLEGWEEGDNPVAEHKRQFPACTFIQKYISDHPVEGVSQGKIMQDAEMFDTRSTDTGATAQDADIILNYPDHSSLSMRVKSFHSWPKSQPSPGMLAQAGFYYTGISDEVKCYACGGTIDKWTADEDPMTEHKNFYPNCPLFAHN